MQDTGYQPRITIEKAPNRWRAKVSDKIVADTADALFLREGDMAPVVYFPKKDVDLGFFTKTNTTSGCPHKGEASYYSVLAAGEVFEDIAWTYEAPSPDVRDIAGHLAFYPDRAEIYEVDRDL